MTTRRETNLLTVMAIWEAFLDARVNTDTNDKELPAWQQALNKEWDDNGTLEMLDIALRHEPEIEDLWNSLSDDTCDDLGPFDWEFIPNYVALTYEPGLKFSEMDRYFKLAHIAKRTKGPVNVPPSSHENPKKEEPTAKPDNWHMATEEEKLMMEEVRVETRLTYILPAAMAPWVQQEFIKAHLEKLKLIELMETNTWNHDIHSKAVRGKIKEEVKLVSHEIMHFEGEAEIYGNE